MLLHSMDTRSVDLQWRRESSDESGPTVTYELRLIDRRVCARSSSAAVSLRLCAPDDEHSAAAHVEVQVDRAQPAVRVESMRVRLSTLDRLAAMLETSQEEE
jgi:hypothetical protein